MKKIYSVLLTCIFIFSWCIKREKYQNYRDGRMRHFAGNNGFIVFKRETRGKMKTYFQYGEKKYSSMRTILEEFSEIRNIPCSYCKEILENKDSYDFHQAWHRLKNDGLRKRKTKKIDLGSIALLSDEQSESSFDERVTPPSSQRHSGIQALLAAAKIIGT